MNFLCFQDESQARAVSRASSHKSQEDITRSSSRSRLKLLEKPAEPPKKGMSLQLLCKSNVWTLFFNRFAYLVSMNKIKVGNAPPPNLRQIRSKIGSLDNATHKPGLIKLTNRTIKSLIEFCTRFSCSFVH